MTDLQRLEIRAGEIRKRLAVIGGVVDLTDEIRAELGGLRTEYTDTEDRMIALRIAGDAPVTPIENRSSEGRAFRELIQRSNVGDIFDAAIGKRSIGGASKEIQDHYGLDGNQVPYALLVRSWPDDDALETRAVTPAPGQVAQNQQSIIPYVFPDSAASFMGIDMPTVAVGEAVYPVLTSTLTVGTPAENADQAETTGAFSSSVLSPSRLQAAFFYSREDRARFSGMDASLRENLSMGLSDGLDKEVFAGTNGLFTGTILPNHDVTATTTFDNYIGHLAFGRVDGRYASTTSDLRVLMGNTAYNQAGQTYRNTSVDRTALDRLIELVAGVRVSAHVPVVASKRQNVVVRRGSNRDMVAPIWEGVTIIPDEITKAKAGQIVITAVMLHAVKVLRQDGFYKQQIQTP